MQMIRHIRRPFLVEAVEITTENIEEVAELVGTLKKKDDGTPFIQVDKRLVPHAYRVYPGYWLTKMNDNIRCYSPKVFRSQFVMVNNELLDATELICNASLPKDEPSLFSD